MVSAELDIGEAFLFLGTIVHGGGENSTTSNRPMHAFFFCRSWLRPEVCWCSGLGVYLVLLTTHQENQHLWWKEEEVRKWSAAAQKQAGYILDNPYLGHCSLGNPLDLFRSSTNDMDEVSA